MRRGIVIGVVAGAAVLVAGAGVTWWLLAREPGPDSVAASYLEALERGDADAALALVSAEVPDADAAFAGAGGFIDAASVRTVEESGAARASASVSFTLGGEEHTVVVALIDTDAGWRIDSAGLGSLTASTTLGDAVGVGAAILTADEAHPLLPAVYPVVASPVGLVTGSASAVVLPGDAAETTIEAAVAPEATTAAQEQLDAYVEECTRPAAEIPAACGIRIPWQADLTSVETIAYRIEQAPVVAIADDGTAFAATDGILVATVSGQSRSGGAGAFTYRTDTWSLYGSVAFHGDGMTLAVR